MEEQTNMTTAAVALGVPDTRCIEARFVSTFLRFLKAYSILIFAQKEQFSWFNDIAFSNVQ
jgi:hypothetical protein